MKLKKRLTIVISAVWLSIALIIACFGKCSSVVLAEEQYTNSSEAISADGYGTMPVGMPLGRAKVMARRAAVVDAQRNLVETIQGTAVDSETTVNNFMLTDDIIKTKVSGVIKGAVVKKEEVTEDGLYHVIMEVPMYGSGSVADIAYNAVIGNKEPVKLPLPEDNFNESYVAQSGGFTGLVIDASGTGLEKTFCPAIYDTNGRSIYGVHNVDKDYAILNGIVEYADSVGSYSTRAGTDPMIIKIVALKPRVVNKCDVIISVEDANRLLAENQRTHFLDRYSVVFLK